VTEHSALRDPEYSTPGDSRGLLSLPKHRYLLSLLIKKGVATRYYGSALGWAWSYIRPLAQFFMYWIVIGELLGMARGRGMVAFPVYLFAGITMINLFSETLRATTSSITSNKALIQKIYFPRELFPVAAAVGAIIHYLPQAVLLVIICLVLGWTVTWMHILAFLAAIVIVMTFALGLGLFFGGFNVAYRDSKNIVDLILMFATWTSPVLYLSYMVHERAVGVGAEWIYFIYMSNPATVAVELSHSAFWEPLSPGTPRPEGLWWFALVGFVISLVTLAVGQYVFYRMEGRFAQEL